MHHNLLLNLLKIELNMNIFLPKSKIFVVVMLLFVSVGFAQITGDYLSNGNVSFAANTNWQIYNGSAWVIATQAPKDATFTSSNTITVQSAHTATISTTAVIAAQFVVQGVFTLNSGASLSIGPMTVDKNGPGSAVNIDSGSVLTVNGNLTVTKGDMSVAGTVYINGNFSTNTGNVTVTGGGSIASSGSMTTQGSGTIFGSTGDCGTGPCSGTSLSCPSTISPASQVICQSSQSAPITFTRSGASIVKWQSTTDLLSFTDITNTTSILPAQTLTQTTRFRAVYTSSGCSGNINSPYATVTVNPTLTASVSIVASATTICPGASVTFTATPTNGGTTPTYQWQINGTNVSGQTASTFTSTTLANSDVIRVVMTSNATPCLTGSPATSSGITMTVNIIGYANLQFPGTGTICQGGGFTAYGQVYISGVTEAAGAGAGITAELGYSTSNTNPSGWTNWVSATFNTQVGNNDEYHATFGSLLTAGTYYYAFRYSINGCTYQYGGFSGGFWGGSNISGVLTVNPLPVITNITTSNCSATGFTVTPINVTNGTVPSGTAYSWSAPIITGGLTGGASGSGASSITGTLTNPTNANQTATYTVTPSSAGCPGTTFTVTVTINPKPSITNMTASSCSAAGFTVTPVNVTNGTVPSGTTYSWSAPTVTGGLTGGTSGSGASSITGTLTNPTNADQTATYTVTPISGTCTGNTFTVTVTLNGLNFVNLQSPATGTICEGGSFTAYGQVYEPGITDSGYSQSISGLAIVAQIGYSSSDTNPGGWTTWINAPFNTSQSINPNNDEFFAALPTTLTSGTYYYAFRYSINGCAYQYGGYSYDASGNGGGFWNGTTNASGVLTVGVTTPTVGTITQPTCALATGSVVLNGLPAGNWTINPGGITGNTTSKTISGLAVGTYNFTVTNASGCTSSATSNVVINVFVAVTNTWDGSVWSTGLPPTEEQNIVFNGNYPPMVDPAIDIVGCSCQVNALTEVIIKTGRKMTITNEVNVNVDGILTFDNKSSLVQINNAPNINKGDIQYIRTTDKGIYNTDYVYWSSPVEGMTLGMVSNNQTLSDKYYSYEPTATGEDWKQESSLTTMVSGNGYIIRGPENSPQPGLKYTATFSGVPHNGHYEITPIFEDKSYLLGNPYPSALDADTFLAKNAAVLNGTLYFWTHNTDMQARGLILSTAGSGAFAYTSNDYATYNATGGVGAAPPDSGALTSGAPVGSNPRGDNNANPPSGKIASGQGFFASTKIGMTDTKIVFDNDMRVGVIDLIKEDNSQFFKTRNPNGKTAQTKVIEKNRVWLNLSNTQGAFKQTLIGYITDATNDYDDRFDGESFDANEYLDFYSVNQDKNLVIQGRALPFDENDEVPLGFRTTINGDFTINIDQVDGSLTNQAVFIEDKLTNTVTDLKSGNYTFNTTPGTFNDRFVLKYTNKTLGTNNFDSLENKVLVSNKNKQIKINSSVEMIDKVTIYDLLGRQIYQKNKVNSNELSIPNLTLSSQVLVVKTLLQNGKTVANKVIY